MSKEDESKLISDLLDIEKAKLKLEEADKIAKEIKERSDLFVEISDLKNDVTRIAMESILWQEKHEAEHRLEKERNLKDQESKKKNTEISLKKWQVALGFIGSVVVALISLWGIYLAATLSGGKP